MKTVVDTLKTICIQCGLEFLKSHKLSTVCSTACREERAKDAIEDIRLNNLPKYAEKARKYRAENLYKLREYQKMIRYRDWRTYMNTLVRRGKQRQASLDIEIVLEILEKQKYKCAISGIEMTHEIGNTFNASIDRVDNNKLYSHENIQIVCKCVNSWRSSTNLELFIEICKKVAEHNS